MTKQQPKSKPRKRQIKNASYKSFRLSKRIKNIQPKLPSAFTLIKQSITLLRQNWKFFFGISVIYGLLVFVFVRSIGGGVDVASLKSTVNELGGSSGNLGTSFTLFGILLSGSSSTNTEVVTIYQTIITLVTSMAVIWGLRQVVSEKDRKLSAKDAFYKGMYPLVPLVLVLVVVGLQLIPMSIGGSVYTTTVEGGLAVTLVEQIFWTVLAILLALLSLYMLSSSIFALYIVSLPNMTPMRALRAARQLVLHRRWEVMRKLIAMPLILLVIAGLLVIPVIAFIPVLAEAVFFVSSVAVLPFALTYIYLLYRSML